VARQSRAREHVRPQANAGSEPAGGDLWPERLPRRPVADTRPAAQLLDRIRRVLSEMRSTRS
jgi:hypothetical protein